MRWCCSCSFTASCSCFSSFFPWCSSPLLLLPLSSPLFVVFAASCATLLSLLCFFHSQTSMLKNTGLIDCIKARELHRPEKFSMWGCWCDLLLSCCCSKAKRIACSSTCLLTCSAPQAGKVGFEMQMRSAARSRDGGSSGAPACARRPRWRFFSCSAAAALLFVPISASRFRRASARASRSLSGARSRNARISNNAPQELLGFC